MKSPNLVVSDGGGNLFEIPDLLMAGMTLAVPTQPEEATLLPLPFGSDLFELPKRVPAPARHSVSGFIFTNSRLCCRSWGIYSTIPPAP